MPLNYSGIRLLYYAICIQFRSNFPTRNFFYGLDTARSSRFQKHGNQLHAAKTDLAISLALTFGTLILCFEST
jgi:hypothetical protein